MEKSGRIIGEEISIIEENVHEFFENRTNKKLFHRYNLVNYQDNNPQLALDRDRIEKVKMLPYLDVKGNSVILDIGCGVGRWGDELTKYLTTGLYVGVDYSEHLIDVAKEAADKDGTSDKRAYYCGSFQNIQKTLEDNNEYRQFDLIIINGVMMYINDYDLGKCMDAISKLVSKDAKIYIKESVGVSERYTLKDIYSEELSCKYNAIYRSIKEYENVFSMLPTSIRKIAEGETFEDGGLHNRKETTSYYWIFMNNWQS